MKLITQWDLSALGKSINDPTFTKERAVMEKTYQSFGKKWKKDQSYLTNEQSLKKALDQYNNLQKLGMKEALYLFMSLQLDASNIKLQAASKKFDEFYNKLSDHIRFFHLSLGAIDKKYQKDFLKSDELKEYRAFLQNIFIRSEYLLSEREEKILNLKSGVASGNWEAMLTQFLSEEEQEILVEKTINGKKKLVKEKVGLEQIITENASRDKKVRDEANKVLNDILKSYELLAEKEFNSILENKKIDDELRGFKRQDSSRHINESIDTDVVDTLREVVTKNFKLAHDFYRFKTQLIGQKKFRYNERNLQYGKISREYSYPEAVAITQKAFSRIDTSFVDIFNSFVEGGFVDVEPRKGKRGGAFCISEGVENPVYIMLNFTKKARDISTLAHEAGHGFHAVFSKVENELNYHVPMCTAEVASTFCEDFVFDELLETATDEERLVMMTEKLGDKMQTIFRQIAAYNFEFEVHTEFRKKGYLSKEDIGTLFNKHMKSYLGPSFEFDDHSQAGWVYWHHFRSPFYVYSYAMGLLAAQAMQAEFKKDPKFIKSIKEFYSTGSSLAPVDIFKKMGMDIRKPEFWQTGINEIKDLLKETKKLAKKLEKI